MENLGKIIIRQVTINEVDMLSHTATRAYLDHFKYLWPDEGAWYVGHSFSPDVLKTEMIDTNNLFFISFYDDKPVGFLKLKINLLTTDDITDSDMELERIYICKSATGKGIGKQFMQLTIDIARQYQKATIYLKAMESSLDSIAFYQKTGFEIYGNYILDYPLLKKEYRGMVLMKMNVAGKRKSIIKYLKK